MRSQFSGEDTMTKINCRATYSDFKRFETGARIVGVQSNTGVKVETVRRVAGAYWKAEEARQCLVG